MGDFDVDQRGAQDALQWAREAADIIGAPLVHRPPERPVAMLLGTMGDLRALLVDGARLGDPHVTAALERMAKLSPDGRAHICGRCDGLFSEMRKIEPRWVPSEAQSWVRDGRRYFGALCEDCTGLEKQVRSERKKGEKSS
ncbi:MAG TPA: hypothetical protein VM690_05720 [Gaiellaceae bacterium]|nr:hypothetical protein [Gaiellaceae bacterium]